MKKLTWAVLIATLVALGFGIRKARAQVSEIQPFTAIQTSVTRSAELKVPLVHSTVLAVGGDGQLVAVIGQSQLTTSRANTRLVWNKKAKTKTFIDPAVKMLIVHPYYEDRSLTAGATCQGTPDGQIEGFDVNLMQSPMNDSRYPGGTVTWKQWAAPKLGCYVLRSEILTTDKDGKFVSLHVDTLSEIKIGEPDASYFDTSLPEGYTQGKPEDYKGAIVNHIKAQRAQQPH